MYNNKVIMFHRNRFDRSAVKSEQIQPARDKDI